MITAIRTGENLENSRVDCENRTASALRICSLSVFLSMASRTPYTVQYRLPDSPPAESLSVCESFGWGHAYYQCVGS
jgi:hypothetical protein